MRDSVLLENIAADIPESLAHADGLLTKYGRWAVTGGRNKPATLDRQYIRAADHKESLEAWTRRCEAVPNPLMPMQQALSVQRALAKVPEKERVVLAVLYVPRKVSAEVQLEILRIAPKLARIRHLAGLRMFDNIFGRDL